MTSCVTKLMEPVFIIMGMGTTIAGLMLAIYLPMFEMPGNFLWLIMDSRVILFRSPGGATVLGLWA